MISGVEYCHAKGICHRDLKPENLLLDEDQILKISDFGLSATLQTGDDNSRLLHTTCGTPNYVAPEVLSDKGYEGTCADIWSCGVILYVFLAGYLPFEESTTELLFRKIQRAQFKYPTWFSPGAKGMVYILVYYIGGSAFHMFTHQLQEHQYCTIPTSSFQPYHIRRL